MAEDLRYTLYHYPMSYYTQKVLLALFEKQVKFKAVHVDLMANEQLQDWYYKLHPDGKVPVFQDGDTIVPESDDIIDYIEKHNPEPRLVPSPETETGKEVARWRSLLTSEVPIEVITYGVFYNPEVSVTGLNAPVSISREELGARMKQAGNALNELASKSPELKSAVDRKLKQMEERRGQIGTAELVKAKIDSLQPVFDKVEKQLQTSGAEGWLCGPDYSAADITLSVLLNRLGMLGLSTLFLTDQRPLVAAFWAKVQGRRNMKEMREFAMKSMQEQAAKKK